MAASLRLSGWLLALALPISAAVPTILSTDIGGDIDDTWALVHLLRSPELDLQLVLTETGEARYRGAVAAKLLEVARRTEVPIALGVDFGPMAAADRLQSAWLKDYDLDTYPGGVRTDGAQAFIDLVEAATETVTVIAIGPVPSLAAAIARRPELARKCRLIGMQGSFDTGYGGAAQPVAEYNVRAAVPALRTVLAAPWQEIALTPVDTCGLVILDGAHYARVWSAAPHDPLVEALIQNYCLWAPRVPWMKCDFFTTRSSTLFDNVAVYMAYAHDVLEYETVRFNVTDDGFTVRDEHGPFVAQIAIRWRDLPGFYDHLTQRLVPGGAGE